MTEQSEAVKKFGGDSKKSGTSWRLFTFLFITFTIMVLTYVGLQYGYTGFLNRSINDLDVEIEAASANLELRQQKDLIAFYSQLTNLSDKLDSHIFGSKVFSFLEETTGLRVAYSTVDIAVPERQLIIDGLAASFEGLVQQLVHWQNSPEIEELTLEDNSVVNDLVRFRIRLTFVPEFFSISSAMATGTPEATTETETDTTQ